MKKKLSIAGIFLFCISCSFYSPTAAWVAEDLRKQRKYQEAIVEYQKHIDNKLKQKDNQNSALNPYFYYLLIGDCYLELQKFDAAKKSYLTALEYEIEKELVGAKLRALAEKLEESGQLENAINLLMENRELDTLLFDIDIDKFHKKMLEGEDRKK